MLPLLARDPDRRSGLVQRLLFGAATILAIVAVAICAFAGVLIVRYGSSSAVFGWEATYRNGWFVDHIDPGGPADGTLRLGDQILAINGNSRALIRLPLSEARRSLAAGERYSLRIARDGMQREYRLRATVGRDWRQSRDSMLSFSLSVAWVLVGCFLGVMKPADPVVRLGALACVTYGLVRLRFALVPFSGLLGGPGVTTYLALSLLPPVINPVGYHFYYRFPPGAPPARVFSALAIAFYVWGAVLLVLNCIPLTRAHVESDEATTRLIFTSGITLVAICAVLARNYRYVTSADQLRRIRWVVYGSLAGIAPVLAVDLLRIALMLFGLGYLQASPFVVAADRIAASLTILIPISVCYAVIKHRVFDISVVIRLGVKYLLARHALRMLLALPALGIAYTVILNRDLSVGELVRQNSTYLSWMAAAALGLRFRRQMERWLDRRFFREEYDREKILLELLNDIESEDSIVGMSKLVSARLQLALHPQGVHVWYREKDAHDFTLAYSSDVHPKQTRISSQSGLLRLVEARSGARDLSAGFLGPEKEWLEEAGIALLVPITTTDDRVVGLLTLGVKKSEEPYTPGDRTLLHAVARQMGIVHDNLNLRQQVGDEQRMRHQVLARLDREGVNIVKECPTCGRCFDSTAAACSQDGVELVLSLPVERIVDGKYRLDRLLGKGGMGAVYEALDLRLERFVALKIMLGRAFGDRVTLRRFEKEARALAKLAHPHIITLHDYGSIGGEGAYLVMERIHGETLRSELDRPQRLSPEAVAQRFDQILDGLEFAHASGIIHRDLKPENILIASPRSGHVHAWIADFGLAKFRPLGLTATHSMTEGLVVGTIGYMSPEQLSGEEVDQRADIFSIGVMVVEAVTGRRPFRGNTYAEVMRSLLQDEFHLDGGSQASTPLENILRQCLARNPAERIESVSMLRPRLIAALR